MSLNGSQSFDPDGGAVTYTWSENATVLATSQVATVSLATGVHSITLTARDATHLVSWDTIQVTVSDTAPPTFTFVPPTVVLETPGPASIGQATATDSCSAVTITNNAPAAFPAGRTIVTWTATDAAGNTKTATQSVYVLIDSVTSCPSGTHVILGTSNNDVLNGTSGADCILAFGGQDRIDGKGGNDIIIAGEGDDIVTGGTGDDIVAGGGGQDNLLGHTGNDLIVGSGGDDVISGGDGNDTLRGGTGQDRLNGENGNDILFGNEGDDILNGGAGTDQCVAGSGHDQLIMCE